jgi:integrase
MPKLTDNKNPSYRLHRQSGQAVVTLNGRDILLGKYGTAASRNEYNRRIGEWIQNGRQPAVAAADLSINELIGRYKSHVESYYRHPDGSPTGEADNIRDALKPLRKLYGTTLASDFSPLKLKAVREAMIDPKMIDPNATGKGWCRTLVNHNIHRVRALFAWAVENELVPPAVHHGLCAVKMLKMGRTEARESKPILPVADDVVDATLPYLSSTVTAMVKLQRLTGARPGEIAGIRTTDIDTTGNVWLYRPAQHKTQHHGRQRIISIGPKAQDVLQPFLKPLNPAAYCFSPADSMAEMREQRHQARKTPQHWGNRIGTNRTRKPRRTPSERYDDHSFRRAIKRACDLAFPVPADLLEDPQSVVKWKRDHRWHPNQLRHSAATEIRKRFGLEAAQCVLGHASPNMTLTYAERDQAAASRIAAEVG